MVSIGEQQPGNIGRVRSELRTRVPLSTGAPTNTYIDTFSRSTTNLASWGSIDTGQVSYTFSAGNYSGPTGYPTGYYSNVNGSEGYINQGGNERWWTTSQYFNLPANTFTRPFTMVFTIRVGAGGGATYNFSNGGVVFGGSSESSGVFVGYQNGGYNDYNYTGSFLYRNGGYNWTGNSTYTMDTRTVIRNSDAGTNYKFTITYVNATTIHVKVVRVSDSTTVIDSDYTTGTLNGTYFGWFNHSSKDSGSDNQYMYVENFRLDTYE